MDIGNSKRASRPAHWLAALCLLACLTRPATPLRAQDDWAQRDAWQRPAEVMDALGVKPGSIVGDVGAGTGYFTFHLAERVSPRGKVYAEDIRDDQLAKIRARAAEQKLTRIETILGAPGDPRLPAGQLDAILVVNAYHEMTEYDAMLQGMYRALKPGGLLAIIDAQAKPGKKRKIYQERHRLPRQIVLEHAARNGLQFLREPPGFADPQRKRKYYFLVFEKPK